MNFSGAPEPDGILVRCKGNTRGETMHQDKTKQIIVMKSSHRETTQDDQLLVTVTSILFSI